MKVKIDIMLWDHHRNKDIIASPVSVEGADALSKYILSLAEELVAMGVDKFVGCCPIHVLPEEFLAHMPKTLHVAYYRRSDDMVINMRDASKNYLQ
jgi:hypothetical protein